MAVEHLSNGDRAEYKAKDVEKNGKYIEYWDAGHHRESEYKKGMMHRRNRIYDKEGSSYRRQSMRIGSSYRRRRVMVCEYK